MLLKDHPSMKNVWILVILVTSIYCQSQPMQSIDFQGHRGCRGILPENSIPGFIKALEFPIKTLEMDAAVSKDGKIIISHDPWFNPDICIAPQNLAIDDLSKAYIKDYTYEEIKQFDCGSKGNPRFTDQQSLKVHKPSLADVVTAVNEYCEQNQRDLPYYNIEIKSSPEWDDKTVSVQTFAEVMIKEIIELGIKDKACIQSFDIRALKASREIDSTITLAYLIGNAGKPQILLEELGFTPEIYSPYYKLVDQELVDFCKEQGMQLIPWTVNTVGEMVDLIQLGVDGIITDYPNMIQTVLAKVK